MPTINPVRPFPMLPIDRPTINTGRLPDFGRDALRERIAKRIADNNRLLRGLGYFSLLAGAITVWDILLLPQAELERIGRQTDRLTDRQVKEQRKDEELEDALSLCPVSGGPRARDISAKLDEHSTVLRTKQRQLSQRTSPSAFPAFQVWWNTLLWAQNGAEQHIQDEALICQFGTPCPNVRRVSHGTTKPCLAKIGPDSPLYTQVRGT